MKINDSPLNPHRLSRRHFVKNAAGAQMLAALPAMPAAFAAGSDTMRIGLIGAGRRGTGAAVDCVRSSQGVELVAVADLFPDKLAAGLEKLKKDLGDAYKVKPEHTFVGFDAYRKVIACEVDLVLLCVPPVFRPEHLRAAIEAGKHVFMEKPVAVDIPGVKSILKTSELAAQKGLSIAAGTQRRHQLHYIDIMKRIQEGAIGNIVAAECFWVGDYNYYTPVEKKPEWSDMEWQCRNWNYFTWLSGDHIVEQHVHNLDVINWAVGAPPIQCLAIGGRQQRTEPVFGHIYDHFTVEYEYPGGVRVFSMSRQMQNCSSRVSERILGSKGQTYTDGAAGRIEGPNPYQYQGANPNPYVQEHTDLIAAIRQGKPINEGKNVAESTMTAILGRMSAYTGRQIKWDWAMNASKESWTPERFEFGPLPVAPIAMPGKTPLL